MRVGGKGWGLKQSEESKAAPLQSHPTGKKGEEDLRLAGVGRLGNVAT